MTYDCRAESNVWVDMRRRAATPTGKERYVESLFNGLIDCGVVPTGVVYSDQCSEMLTEDATKSGYNVVALSRGWRFHAELMRATWTARPQPILVSGLGFTPAVYCRRCVPIVYDSAAWRITTVPPRVRLLEKTLRPVALRRKEITVISDATAVEMVEATCTKRTVTVLPPPLTGYWRDLPGRPFDERRGILCVATLNRRKRVDLAIRAYAMMKTHEPLTVIGADGGELASLRDLAHQLGIGERVVFCGPVSDCQVRYAYLSHRVLLNTSEYEGLYLPAFEAMAAGIPVVSTPINALSRWLPEGAFCQATPAAIAQTVQRVMDDHAFWESCASYGIKTTEGLSPRKSAELLLDVCRCVGSHK